MQWNLAVCESYAAWPIWLAIFGLIAATVAVWPYLHRFARLRSGVLFGSLLTVCLLASEARLGAIVPPGPGDSGFCAWLNEQQFPCWVIEAAWCPCWWPGQERQSLPQ